MKRSQTTLEFVFLIGVVAVAVTAMLVYMKRGFQGNIRASVDQLGAGHYEPGNTNITNRETKRVTSTITSTSTTKITYGTGGAENQAMQNNKEEQRKLRMELAALEAEKLAKKETGENNVFINQAAIAAAARIARTNAGGIDTSLTVDEAGGVHGDAEIDGEDNLDSINTAIKATDDALKTLTDSYNTLAGTDCGCDDGCKDRIRNAMAENLAYQAEVKVKRNKLIAKKTALENGQISTAEDKEWILADIDKEITNTEAQSTALFEQRKPLLKEYTRLASKPKPTPYEQKRILELEDAIKENQRQQDEVGATLANLRGQRRAVESAIDLNLVKPTKITAPAIDPKVIPITVPKTLAQIDERISEINAELIRLANDYQKESEAWDKQRETIVPDKTTSTGKNIEDGGNSFDGKRTGGKGTVVHKDISEKLGSF